LRENLAEHINPCIISGIGAIGTIYEEKGSGTEEMKLSPNANAILLRAQFVLSETGNVNRNFP